MPFQQSLAGACIGLNRGLVVLFVFLPACFAQHEHMSRSAVTVPGAPLLLHGSIDVSVTPQLIPDATAYRLFFNVASEQPGARTNEQKRQRAMLSRAQLSEQELENAALILSQYREQISDLENAWNAAVASKTSSGQDFAGQQNSIVSAARSELAAVLSPAGMARLDQLVQFEKRRMKIAPFPSMP